MGRVSKRCWWMPALSNPRRVWGVKGLAAVIIGGTLIRSNRVGWMAVGVLVGSLVYRIAVILALRYGYVIGFQASDLKLITSLLVILALVVPYLRERRMRWVSAC